MPITPFHFAPAILVKSASPARVSWSVFVAVNVAIDLEPILGVLLIDDPIHRYLHNYLAATFVALAVAYWGRPWCERLLVFWNRKLSPAQAKWLGVQPAISLPVAVFSALLGAWPHIWLDSFMHADMQPWQPFSSGNGLHGAIPLDTLHPLCVALGIWGLLRLLTTRWDQVRQAGQPAPGDSGRLVANSLARRRLVGFIHTSFAVSIVVWLWAGQ